MTGAHACPVYCTRSLKTAASGTLSPLSLTEVLRHSREYQPGCFWPLWATLNRLLAFVFLCFLTCGNIWIQPHPLGTSKLSVSTGTLESS